MQQNNGKKSEKVRNGRIELMRFVFCCCVLIFHFDRDISMGTLRMEHLFPSLESAGQLTLFQKGNLSVEFFFLVGGFLMAKSIYASLGREPKEQPLADETLHFLWRKIRGLLPYHILFNVVYMLLLIVKERKNLPIALLLEKLPGLFFLQRIGFLPGAFLTVEWYLSSMLLAMALIYPICKRYYINFSHLFGPLAAIGLLSYMFQVKGRLSGIDDMAGFTCFCNYRALAEIILGVSCFEVCRALQRRRLRFVQCLLLTVAEEAGYLFVLFCMCWDTPVPFDFMMLLMLCVSVTISFSGQGLLSRSILFQNPVCRFLGAVSLPVYLCQNLVRAYIQYRTEALALPVRLWLTLALTIGCGTLTYVGWNLIQRLMRKSSTGAASPAP